MVGKDVELTVTERPGDGKPPYERLFADAMRGSFELFARQDGVEARGAWSMGFWVTSRLSTPTSRAAGGRRRPSS